MATGWSEREERDYSHHYTSYSPPGGGGGGILKERGPKEKQVVLDDGSADLDLHTSDTEEMVDSGRIRHGSFISNAGDSLKKKLKRTRERIQAGLSTEERVVADAFIASNKNRPQYMKKEHTNDLLV